MDIKQLQYLVVSIDNGSFKKASELLYTTQPHISKTIKSLEVELGMQLLKRNARGVEATEEGRKVYEYACRILVDQKAKGIVDRAVLQSEDCIHDVDPGGFRQDSTCAGRKGYPDAEDYSDTG